MKRIDLTSLAARDLAQLIARGEASALDATEQYIARIETVNPKLNAVVVKRYDQARAEARELDARRACGARLGPLAGVPVTVKECIDVAGLPSTFGLGWRKDLRADADAPQVARLKAADAIIVGKTNVAQLLAYVETDNPVYGRSDNPWNRERACGGSSGGEAAIIATGGSPLGLGTDIGGSVRYPAASCGVASIKPSAGRCDDAGAYSFHPGQRAMPSQIGVLAREVDDLALGLDVINGGPEIGDWHSVDLSRLSVGYYLEDGILRTSPAIRRSVREAAQALEASGARVVAWQPPDTWRAFRLAHGLLGGDGLRCFREALRGETPHPSVKTMLSIAGKPRGLLRAGARLLDALGQKSLARMLPLFARVDVHDYWELVVEQLDYRARFAGAMDCADGGPLDLVLGPVCALPALRHGSTKDLGLAGVNTILYNVLGYPAGVVPWSRVGRDEQCDRPASRDIVEKAARRCDEDSAGLPTAVQLAARPWREQLVFAAMHVIETAARRRKDYPHRPEL